MTDLNALGAGGMSDFSGLGIALFPHDGEHADALLRRADAVMYEAGRMCRNRPPPSFSQRSASSAAVSSRPSNRSRA